MYKRQGFDLPKYAAAWTAITGRPFPVPVTPAPTPVPTPTPAPSPLDAVIASMRKAWAAFDAWLKARGI